VNANLRIFSDFRSLNYPSVRGLISNRLVELVMRRFARLVFSTIVWPGVKSVTVPVLSVIVVVVSVVPLLPVAVVVEEVDVCPYATKPMRAVAT